MTPLSALFFPEAGGLGIRNIDPKTSISYLKNRNTNGMLWRSKHVGSYTLRKKDIFKPNKPTSATKMVHIDAGSMSFFSYDLFN